MSAVTTPKLMVRHEMSLFSVMVFRYFAPTKTCSAWMNYPWVSKSDSSKAEKSGTQRHIALGLQGSR